MSLGVNISLHLLGAVTCEYDGWILRQVNVDLLKKPPDRLLQ